MPLDQAAQEALARGAFGAPLLKAEGLDSIPFFQKPELNESAPSVNTHRKSSGPFSYPNEGLFDCQDPAFKADAMEASFIQLNSRFIRFNPKSRLWTRSEKTKLLSRQAPAGSLCVSAFCKLDGTWTRPLLLVTGPLTATWKGIPTACDSPLDLPEWKAPDPSAPNPPNRSVTTGAPVATSVATNSRASWDALEGKAASRLPTLLSKVPILVNPDARTLAGYLCVRNPSGTDTSSLLECQPRGHCASVDAHGVGLSLIHI